MGILLFELFRNPLFMGILNKWETLVKYNFCARMISCGTRRIRRFNNGHKLWSFTGAVGWVRDRLKTTAYIMMCPWLDKSP